jgi:hypothetical protein
METIIDWLWENGIALTALIVAIAVALGNYRGWKIRRRERSGRIRMKYVHKFAAGSSVKPLYLRLIHEGQTPVEIEAVVLEISAKDDPIYLDVTPKEGFPVVLWEHRRTVDIHVHWGKEYKIDYLIARSTTGQNFRTPYWDAVGRLIGRLPKHAKPTSD